MKMETLFWEIGRYLSLEMSKPNEELHFHPTPQSKCNKIVEINRENYSHNNKGIQMMAKSEGL